jgi:hypothetical protein
MAKAAADHGRFVPHGASPAASRRAAVLFETPQSVAARRTVSPVGASDDRRVTLGRPSLCPCDLARANPARTRSRTRSRSNSAIAPSTCSCKRPAGVVVSIPSFRETKPTPTAVNRQAAESSVASSVRAGRAASTPTCQPDDDARRAGGHRVPVWTPWHHRRQRQQTL